MRIVYIECKECGLRFRKNRTMYVATAAGDRVKCIHPLETYMAWDALKPELCWLQRKLHSAPESLFDLFEINGTVTTLKKLFGFKDFKELLLSRKGYLSWYYCRTCNSKIELDADKDTMACPECNSPDVVYSHDLIGGNCPQCSDGMIVSRNTGMIT